MSDKYPLQLAADSLEAAIRDHLHQALCDLPGDLAERAERQFKVLQSGLSWDGLTPFERLHAARRFDELTQHHMQLKRQRAEKSAAGRYTLAEAAEAIGTSDESSDIIQKKLCAAAKAGNLPVFEPGKRARLEYASDSPVRSYYEEAYWDDLNEWLGKYEPRVNFSFPAPEQRKLSSAHPSVRSHKLENKRHALDHIFAAAESHAGDPANYLSVWAEMVGMAQSANIPSPLIGYVEGEGIKYQTDTGVKFFTRNALRKRLSRRV